MKSFNVIVATIILTTATISFASENGGYVPDSNNTLWAQRGWPGEYPEAGLKLTKKVTFKAAAKLTDALSGIAVSPKKCTFVAGNYHPWAQKTKATYASISSVKTFIVKEDTTITYTPDGSADEKSIALKAGDKLKELAYQAEGYCTIEVNGKAAYSECLGMNDKLSAEKAEDSYSSSQEGNFIYAACSGKGESGSGWVKVNNALFQIDGIDETEIADYGSIKE